MAHLAEEEKSDAAATNDDALIRSGKGVKHVPKQFEPVEAQKPGAQTEESANLPVDPHVPIVLVVAFAAGFFILFFTTIGLVFRSRWLYPLLHRIGVTDECGAWRFWKKF